MTRARSTINDAVASESALAAKKRKPSKRVAALKATDKVVSISKGKGRGKKRPAREGNLPEDGAGEGHERASNWTFPEKMTLFLGANARKSVLRESFKSHSGGVKARKQAWLEVSDMVNELSVMTRTPEACRKKVGTFCSEVKEKHRKLMQARNQTGAGRPEAGMYLDCVEQMALDYVGEECVLGISGVEGTPLKHSGPRDYMPKFVKGPWNPHRLTKPNYGNFK